MILATFTTKWFAGISISERQANIQAYIKQTYTHTLFENQFQETRHAPTAGLLPAMGTCLV